MHDALAVEHVGMKKPPCGGLGVKSSESLTSCLCPVGAAR